MSKHADRRDEMRRLLSLRKREGLTYAELSELSGFAISTLQSWNSRLRREAAEAPFAELVCAQSEGSLLSPEESNFSGIRLHLEPGISIEVSAGFDSQTLSRVVETLRSC